MNKLFLFLYLSKFIQNTEVTSQIDDRQFTLTTMDFTTQRFVDPCNEFGLCNFTRSLSRKYCHCDEKCHEFNDCCLNFDIVNSNISIYTPYYQCYRGSSVKTNNYGFMVVGTCPDQEKNLTLIDLCHSEDVKSMGPCVTAGDVIFRNKYCSLCHNVTTTLTCDVTFSAVSVSKVLLNGSREEKLSFYFKRSTYKLVPPTGIYARSCMVDLLQNDDERCQKYINPVAYFQIKLLMYRNSFCAPVDIRDAPICMGKTITAPFNDGTIYPLTVIFSFNEKSTKDILTLDNKCTSWMDEMLLNGQCAELETYKNFEIALIPLYISSNFSLTTKDAISIGYIYAWTFEIKNTTKVTLSMNVYRASNASYIYLKMKMKVIKTSFLHEIQLLEQQFNNRVFTIYISDPLTGNTVLVAKESNLSTQWNNRSVLESISVNMRTSIKNDLIGYEVTVNDHSISSDCKHVYVNIEENQNSTLSARDIVCTLFFADHGSNIRVGKSTLLEAIVTYCCFSVSIISLIVLIVFNRKLEFSNSIVGSNTENLSLSIIVSNVLFMVGSYTSKITPLCYIIGVLLHYLWLSVFSFMSIAVLYICKHLITMKPSSRKYNHSRRSTKRVLSVVGILLPSLLVGPAVVFDQYDILHLSSGYGVGICFPNKYPANVIFFSGPVLVSVLINVLSLTCVFAKVCRVRFEIRHIIQSPPFQEAKVFLRFLMISGIFWVTGIFAAVYENESIEYVFILLCGLQGLFITIANLTTSRVQHALNSNLKEPSAGNTNSIS